ncbi:unnamed protein product [Effrenium voratum]|uniref:Sodium/calcium exchanger membrane region domain-containing protein n=1 Tax=Effrenium voratum TaxID=2562239 RepID=A0AA36MK90_9DINO|nr:unnamed protein product [Effrenium voratum]
MKRDFAERKEEVRIDKTVFPGQTEVKVDITYLRWLWWPAILYLFWSMAHVCDIHFVRTIEVICERFHIPDDVAGATLMALGCNGPELALNTINIFQPSSIGVGAVVGGEVFNVLVIIGTAVLATPDEYLPLKLSRPSFFRDVSFYVLSVLLLFWALHDGEVSRVESLVLLLGGVLYVLSVIFTARIWHFLNPPVVARETLQPLMDENHRQCTKENLNAWGAAGDGVEPTGGTLLSIRADNRNRLMDRNHRFENRFVLLQDESLIISTVADPTEANEEQCDVDMVYDRNEHAHENHWHRAGMVKNPEFLDERQLQQLMADPLTSIAQHELFRDAPWEVIPLEEVLYCEKSHDGFHLHVDHGFGNIITLEIISPKSASKTDADEETLRVWYVGLREKLIDLRRRSADRPPEKSWSFLKEWVAWAQFPVTSLAGATIPDMDRPDLQHLYPLAFLMSMLWLGLLSSLVVTACDGIHNAFDIPNNVLGFTVAAAGTSFPNVFSGICVARQGKAGMAVANALGANVQNVFLALAIPWTIQSVFLAHGPFPLHIHGLAPAVIEIFITLMPLALGHIERAVSMPQASLIAHLVMLGRTRASLVL